jgi:hypothetical protein
MLGCRRLRDLSKLRIPRNTKSLELYFSNATHRKDNMEEEYTEMDNDKTGFYDGLQNYE